MNSELEAPRSRSQENADYARAVVRGRQAQQLLGSQLWLKHIGPYFAKKIEDLPQETMWRPNHKQRTVDEIALHSAFCGGWENAARQFLKELRTWIEQGEAAEKALKNRGIEI